MTASHIALLGLGMFLAFAAPAAATHAPTPDVDVRDVREGTGRQVERHASLRVHYTGWLEDGTEFDSSRSAGRGPFEFKVGAGSVIPGWDIGLVGMKEGGIRELVVPPELAYGDRGAGSVIPPGAVLKFEIELLGVVPPLYTNVDNGTLQELLDRGVTLIDIRRPYRQSHLGDRRRPGLPGRVQGCAQRCRRHRIVDRRRSRGGRSLSNRCRRCRRRVNDEPRECLMRVGFQPGSIFSRKGSFEPNDGGGRQTGRPCAAINPAAGDDPSFAGVDSGSGRR